MLVNVDVHGDPVPTARFMGGREFETSSAAQGESAAAIALARNTDRCLDRLGTIGDVIVEGPFARNSGFCESLAALRASQPMYRSDDDATGTLTGASLLARWSVGSR